MLKSLTLLLSLTLCTATSSFAFGPCQKKMPREVSYLPALEQCGGKAAIVLSGRYLNSFSVVVRDCNNNDRDPCHAKGPSCPTNAGSPFKVQKVIRASILRKEQKVKATIHCLKEAGSHPVYKLVRRLTIKLRNPIQGPQDIVKICLPTRTAAINKVDIFTTTSQRNSSSISSTLGELCASRLYLSCDYSYGKICPKYY